MTREERCWEDLCKRLQRDPATSEESDTCTLRVALKHALAFADAEAAAMRERAAGVADEMQETRNAARLNALSRKEKGEARDHETMAMAAAQIKRAIRALPATGEVGRG